VANSSGPQTWNLTLGYGSLQEFLFTFTYPSTGVLYPISGLTWEYVARTSGTATGSPLFSVTTTPSASGVLTVDTAASTVQLTLYPAATQSVATGDYVHALWSDPGTDTAYTWLSGAFLLQGNPQP
jgi:hypothetical protein